ncbi:MAG: hypothetical protein Q7T30_03795, partial [Planctomycetota bacterium]|nr:hypothetical protein [Planctomycetota bacterium]
MRVFATTILTLFLCSAVSTAQQPTVAPQEVAVPLTVPPGEMEVPKLVELIGRYARCNIFCDPAEIGRVKTIVLTEPVQ